MKLTTFFFLISFAAIASTGYSQPEKVTIHLKDASIKDLFSIVEKQTFYKFLYRDDAIENIHVNIDEVDIPLDQLLKQAFEDSIFGYKILANNLIVIAPYDLLQQSKVSGTVTDGKTGEPLPGVSVVVKGTTHGTSTDINGNYSISDIPENAILSFSFVGMKSKEIAVNNQTTIDVTLSIDAIGLSEVIVIGYGTAKKEDLTGSIINVKAEELTKFKPTSVSDMLRFSAAGLNVSYSTDAKATPDFAIRGDNTIKSSSSDEISANKPLIVVDGVIFDGDLAEINVNDVESIDVLKDASSASIYGSRASNGVVVFTTKKGKSARPTIQFNSSFGFVTPFKRLKSFNGTEVIYWLEKMNESINSKLMDPWSKWTPYENVSDQYKADWLAANNIPGETDMGKITSVWLDNFGFDLGEKENYLAGRSYNWEDWLFHTGKRQNYDINISGRSEKISYYWSIGYKNYESVQVGDKFSTIISRLNLDVAVTDFLHIGLNSNFSYENDGPEPIPNSNLNPSWQALSDYDTPWINGAPHTREYLKLHASGNNQVNPLLNPAFEDRQFDWYKLNPTAYIKLKLPLGFTFTSNFTQRFEFRRRFEFFDPANPIWTHGGQISRINDQVYNWSSDNILNWNKEFGLHRLDVTGLWNAEHNQNWQTNAFTQNLSPNAVLGYHVMDFGLLPSTASDDETNSRDAVMGRINYSYSNKYNLSASIRRDGYSRFGKNHLYAIFPSLSAAWTITNEGFMTDRPKWFSYLKLRASWGVNGNSSGIGDYAAYASLASNKYLNYNSGYQLISYLYINRMSNFDLAWEKNQAWNIGIDYGFWNDRISGAIDVYTSKTTDLLLNKILPIVTGFGSITTNVGSLKNDGFDFSLSTVNIERSNFRWTSKINISFNRNKILSLTGQKTQIIDANGSPVFDTNGNPVMKEPDDTDNGWFIGQNKDVIWDYQIAGVWKTSESDSAKVYGFYPGDFKVIDQNHDGKLNNSDKVFQGLSKNPWYLTFRNDFAYKNFDIAMVFLAKLGYKGGSDLPFNNHQAYIKNHNWYNLPFWTPENQIDDYARINSIRLSNMLIYEYKSYVRFQNFSLGYHIPKKQLETIKISSARVAFNVDNVGILTKWKLGDPESNSEMARTYTFSLDFSF
ncbi:MAG: SusC/RagA family TonB-linked outer membrane protein [Bacteroidales bacterium]|jgi:TonB-linked SusC/RagA family outer membrane protein|nr:SusC/RagA family TonB-linked outer membrane protein [Bacteroidales bacterium]